MKTVVRHLRVILPGGFASVLLTSFAAHAAGGAEQVLLQARHRVVGVEVLNSKGNAMAQGSGLVSQTGQVITTCDLIDGAASALVRYSGKTFKASLRDGRKDRNLCELHIPDLHIPKLAFGTARQLWKGAHVYTVGMPSGQEAYAATSETEVAALRPFEGSQYIRISAVVSPEFRGGALFSDAGQLIGMLSPQRVEGQDLTFALPADWISDMVERVQHSVSVSKKESGLDWLNRTLALEKKGDWPGLLKLSQQQVKREPASAAAWFSLGYASTQLRRYDEAIYAFRQAIRNQADYADTWHQLGVAYAQLKQYDHAIPAYRDALRLQPSNAEVWHDLGNAYHESGQYPYAIHAYREALRFQPENAEVWYSLGNTYDELKLYGEAVEAYRETVRIQPKNVDAWYSLGVGYAREGERAKMTETYRALREVDPAKAELYFNTYILP